MSHTTCSAKIINRTLRRLPLVLEILEEIEDGCELDDALRQGAHEAVRRMVQQLGQISLTEAGQAARTEPELEIARSWLLGERPRKLLPQKLYEELDQLIGEHISPYL